MQTALRALCAALLLTAATATAAPINHFRAASGPHNYIVNNHPAVLRHMTISSWIVGTYAHEPLVCRDDAGAQVYPIVEHQVNGELAAAWGLFDRLEVGGSVPATFLYGPPTPDNPAVLCGGFDPEGITTAAIADPRVFAKFLLTPWNEGLVASIRLATDIPLAQLNEDASSFAGERRFPSVVPGVSVGYSSKWFKTGANLGAVIREPAPIGDELLIGSELQYGLGAELTAVPGVIYVDADIYGKASFDVGGAFVFGNRTQLPLEAVIGGKFFVGPVAMILGVGTGIIADYGAPDARVFAGIGYYPPEPEPEPEEEGPGDRDGDGILDPDDECPDAPEDIDGFEDEDGCPDVDNDEDGILDVDDGCPDDPEDRDRWEDADGCPDPDNDKDEILDVDDECPNDPEVYNDFEDEDGCPDSADPEKKVLVIVKREKVEILDKVYFAFDSDRILPKSYELLDNVAKVIKEHTEIPKILVEGHTSSEGSDKYNLDLSDRRAKSVMRYLIAAGVDPFRLDARGFGESTPIADNDTEDGRSKNRRVEFTIVQPEEDEEAGDDESDATEDEESEGDDYDFEDEDGEEARGRSQGFQRLRPIARRLVGRHALCSVEWVCSEGL
jgi:outer membrane protein OmpA-like peptidoglycan-associated protein